MVKSYFVWGAQALSTISPVPTNSPLLDAGFSFEGKHAASLDFGSNLSSLIDYEEQSNYLTTPDYHLAEILTTVAVRFSTRRNPFQPDPIHITGASGDTLFLAS
jgi:hypothetical protein